MSIRIASAAMRPTTWRTRLRSPATSCSDAFLNDVPLPLTTVTQPSMSAALSSRATVST